MKQYLLFAGATCTSPGGWKDLIGAFDSPEEAGRKIMSMVEEGIFVEYDLMIWWHIVDGILGDIIRDICNPEDEHWFNDVYGKELIKDGIIQQMKAKECQDNLN